MRRRTDRLTAACAVVCIACVTVLGFVIAPATLDTSKVAADNARLGRENAKRIRDVAELARAIQDQRVDSILRNCRSLNGRHRNTLRALDVLISRLPPGAERARAKANRMGTVFLLNQIVPYQNCRKLVAKTAPTP